MVSHFKSAAQVFFDYDRIELYDEAHSEDEDRYNTIGDVSSWKCDYHREFGKNIHKVDDVLFVVYTEREMLDEEGKPKEVIRLISARLATSFERGIYYGKRS